MATTPPDVGAYPANGAYPGSNNPIIPTPYLEPAAENPVVLEPTPTIDASLGQVKGRLLEAKQPAANVHLFLAALKTDAEGNEPIAKYSPGSSPKAITNENGEFVFVNIPPGRYAIVLDIVIEAYLLNIPDKQETLTITVEAGKTFDVETLDYDDLPLPPPQ